MSSKLQHCVEAVPRIADIPAAAWDACANPDPAVFNPFLAHGFLRALEDAGTVGGRSGWTPRHLVLKDGNPFMVFGTRGHRVQVAGPWVNGDPWACIGKVSCRQPWFVSSR